jgi:hypothetical protein
VAITTGLISAALARAFILMHSYGAPNVGARKTLWADALKNVDPFT